MLSIRNNLSAAAHNYGCLQVLVNNVLTWQSVIANNAQKTAKAIYNLQVHDVIKKTSCNCN